MGTLRPIAAPQARGPGRARPSPRADSQRPLVLVVEDLHWIDPESHEVLDKLVDSLGMSRVFVVASFRPQFQPGIGPGIAITRC